MKQVIHETADMQMECSEDAIRIEWIHMENNGCLYQHLENQNSLGELLCKTCTGNWERNLRRTSLNMYNPILMATILKALREQLEEDDQMNTAGEIAGSIPEPSRECEPVLKERRGFWRCQRWKFA